MLGKIGIIEVVVFQVDERCQQIVFHKNNTIQNVLSLHRGKVESGVGVGYSESCTEVKQMKLRDIGTHFLLVVSHVETLLIRFGYSEMLIAVAVAQAEIGQRRS
jgi:L-arabinose isomerase